MSAPPQAPQEDPAGGSGTVAVTVVIDEAHRPTTDAVCAQLRVEGMRVEQVLPLLGLVTGELPEDRLPAARGVEGVSSVERQHGYQLPLPDAEVQ